MMKSGEMQMKTSGGKKMDSLNVHRSDSLPPITAQCSVAGVSEGDTLKTPTFSSEFLPICPVKHKIIH